MLVELKRGILILSMAKIRHTLCNVQNRNVLLKDLLVGQAFYYGRYYIKTNRIYAGRVVAVDMQTGAETGMDKALSVTEKDFVIIRNEAKITTINAIPKGELFTININDKTFLKVNDNEGVNVKTGFIEHIPKELSLSYKFAAKNPQACLWDESRFLLDNNIEKIYNLCIIQNNERLVLAMYECPKDCLSCANSFSEPAVNDNEPDVLHCMEKDGQIVEETDCCDKYN